MLRVAIIGAGSIAKRHISAIQANPYAEVACICDMNEARVQAIAKEFGLTNYCTDYMDILKDETVDAVSILTPTFTHKQIVLDAIAAGKHVLCEKPPFLTVAEAEECARAAEKSDKLLKFLLSGVAVTGTEIGVLLVGSVVSFIVSMQVIKGLMEYVRKHSFSVFGIYRIVLGIIVLGYFLLK